MSHAGLLFYLCITLFSLNAELYDDVFKNYRTHLLLQKYIDFQAKNEQHWLIMQKKSENSIHIKKFIE